MEISEKILFVLSEITGLGERRKNRAEDFDNLPGPLRVFFGRRGEVRRQREDAGSVATVVGAADSAELRQSRNQQSVGVVHSHRGEHQSTAGKDRRED